jgi:phosphoglycerate kinase
MTKKTLADVPDLRGKRVLIRVDFNVPQDAHGNISNDRRIRAALPTIRQVLDAGASAILMSHFGRPDPKADAAANAPFKMDRIAERLSQLLGRPVRKVDEVVGLQVDTAVKSLKPGEVLLLENMRFHPGEQGADKAKKAKKEGKPDKAEELFRKTRDLAAQLAKLGDVYVNDAFGTCHRQDASMLAVPQAMAGKPRVVGILVAKELEILGQLLSAPPRPLIGILGGAKVSDKIGFIKKMLALVDKVLIGGAMTYTFMKAQGRNIGGSRCEADKLDTARELLQLGQGKIVLPVDHLVADKPEAGARTQIVTGDIPDGWLGMDIGPQTIARYCQEIAQAGTVVWNGPMGKFEDEPFRKGTKAVAEAMAVAKGVTIVGGGETAEAVEAFGLAEKMTHVSTGGGAFLEYVEGTPFLALEQIDERKMS